MIDNTNNQNGSVLVTILAVFLVISLLFGSVLLYGSWHKFEAEKALLDLKASYLAEAGVNRAVWCLSGNDNKDIRWRVEDYHSQIDNTNQYHFRISNWGGYLAIESQGKSGAKTKKVKAIIGQKPDKTYDNAINLGDPAYPLVVAGRNRIIGDIKIGPAGIMPGRFEGEEFVGGSLVEGNVLVSKNLTPHGYSDKMIEEFKQTIKEKKENIDLVIDRTLIADDKTKSDYFKNKNTRITGNLVFSSSQDKSFQGPGYIFCDGKIEITKNTKLYDGLVLIADKDIVLLDNCQLKDCLLYSKSEINIKDNVIFKSQAISDTSIVVEGHASTFYPTLLLVEGKRGEKSIEGSISIESDNPVEGILMYCGKEMESESKLADNGIIMIKPNSSFCGIIYSTNYATIEGNVSGCVNTNKFYFEKPPTTYINWLNNALIDRTKLKKEMILPLCVDGSSRLEILSYMQLN